MSNIFICDVIDKLVKYKVGPIRIFIYISVCVILFVRILGSTPSNLALLKPATMSSVFDGKSLPEFSVDGNLGTNWYTDHCSTTQHNDMEPWWLVDLHGFFVIHDVNITNRGDQYPERLHSFVIEVFKNNPTRCSDAKSDVCFNYTGPALGAGETRAFHCTSSIVGRFLRVKKWKMNGNQDTLILCEVHVFGAPGTGCNYQRSLNRHSGYRMMSLNSQLSDAQQLNECLLRCMKQRVCLEFNFNKDNSQCELITAPRFNDSSIEAPSWDYYADLC